MFDIKANEALFNRWRSLGLRVQQLCGIVQNDQQMTLNGLEEWQQEVTWCQSELRSLEFATQQHVWPNDDGQRQNETVKGEEGR